MAKTKTGLPFYSWDTTVMIAWLSDEQGAPLGNIDAVVAEIDSKRANLLLALTVLTEILESKYTKEQLERYNRFLEHPNVIMANDTQAIALKARNMRDAALPTGRKLKTPDATIMATASLFKVDVLHTLEPKLIALDGSPIVDGLHISLPITRDGQGGLDFTP